MTKKEFIDEIRSLLKNLPKCELEERLSFYIELIDDSIEDGLSEEEAINKIGGTQEVALQIASEISQPIDEKTKSKPKKRINGFTLSLIIIGSPIWIALLACVFAVAVSLFASVWCVIACLWGVVATLFGVGLGGIVSGVAHFIAGYGISSLSLIGTGVLSSGLFIISIYAGIYLTKCAVKLNLSTFKFIKNKLIKREEA